MKKSFPIKPLQSLCDDFKQDIVDGPFGSELKREDYITEGIPVLKIQNVKPFAIELKKMDYVSVGKFHELRRHSFRRGDIVMTKLGSPLGVSAIVEDLEEGVIVADLVRVRAQQINTKYLCYHLNSQRTNDFINSMQKGTTRPRVTLSVVRELPIYAPPLPEQQRIVGILDEAFADIATAKANAEKNLHNARALFESHLQSVFTQRGPGWVDRQLASLCHEITVGHVGPMRTQYKESGVPFLRSQNIRPFEISMENAMFIDAAFHRALKKSQLRPGDLAIVRTGYPGTAAVIPPELPDSNCSDLVIVRPSKEVSPHFLAAFFNSAFGKQLVLGKIVGAAQKHFNITAAKDVMLHVPPMPEQRAIIVKSDKMRAETQRLSSIYQQKLDALEALKKSLLHQAFTGAL